MRLQRVLYSTALALRCFAQNKETNDVVDPDPGVLFSMEVTTASKFSEKLSGAAGVMSVVTQDELQRFGALTLAEALEACRADAGVGVLYRPAHGNRARRPGRRSR